MMPDSFGDGTSIREILASKAEKSDLEKLTYLKTNKVDSE
jgi:hypothetical protein